MQRARAPTFALDSPPSLSLSHWNPRLRASLLSQHRIFTKKESLLPHAARRLIYGVCLLSLPNSVLPLYLSIPFSTFPLGPPHPRLPIPSPSILLLSLSRDSNAVTHVGAAETRTCLCARGSRCFVDGDTPQAAAREVAPEGVGQGPTHLAALVRHGGCGAGLDAPEPYSPAFGMWSDALSSAGVLVAARCPLSVPIRILGFNQYDTHTRGQECIHTLPVHGLPAFRALRREYMPRRSSESILTTACAVRVMLLSQWIARGTGGVAREARCVGAARRMKGSMGACRCAPFRLSLFSLSSVGGSSRVRDSKHQARGARTSMYALARPRGDGLGALPWGWRLRCMCGYLCTQRFIAVVVRVLLPGV
ncbi:hypothetical protein B0H13DRAFT_2651868, partial [Mycena leptocephala]